MFKIIMMLLLTIDILAGPSFSKIELYSYVDVVSSGIIITSGGINLNHETPNSDSKVESTIDIKTFAPDGVVLDGLRMEVTLKSSSTSGNNLVLGGDTSKVIPHRLSAVLGGVKESKTIMVEGDKKTASAIVEGCDQVVKLKAVSEVSKAAMANKPKGEYTNTSTISIKILAN
ncbi:MAG: hypothetical protein ACRC8M_08610 [Cetobacterium sp.]|uniref:hypothetical protein n=1 Tax=Cetobacterium sp. TaxID=2071632 RepID=UPI003F3EFD2C